MISLMHVSEKGIILKCTSLLYTRLRSVYQHVVKSFSHHEEPVSINQAHLSVENSGKMKSFQLLRCEDVRMFWLL